MQKYLIAGLSLALLIAAGLAVWQRSSFNDEREAHNVTRADNARLLSAAAMKDATIIFLRQDLKNQGVLLAERDARIAQFNEVACEAAIAIQGAANDSPDCDIDAPLPDALVRPLRVLYSQAAGRGRDSGGESAPSGPPVSGQAHARPAQGSDGPQSLAVDGPAHAVGQ